MDEPQVYDGSDTPDFGTRHPRGSRSLARGDELLGSPRCGSNSSNALRCLRVQVSTTSSALSNQVIDHRQVVAFH